jgi:hypothetical protein
MSRKSKPTAPKVKSASAGPTSSLAQGPAPAARLAELEKRAAERGIKPVEDFDQFLEEVGDVWPEEEDLEEFLAWLRKSRQEGRY